MRIAGGRSFGPLVERAEDAVQLRVVHHAHVERPGQEDGVLLADLEGRTRHRAVATQEVGVEPTLVLLRRRHHVRLVVQAALAQMQPDGEDVLLLAGDPHEPTPLAWRRVALDMSDQRVLVTLPHEPCLDQSGDVVQDLRGRGLRHSGEPSDLRLCRGALGAVDESAAVRSAYRRRRRPAAVDQV